MDPTKQGNDFLESDLFKSSGENFGHTLNKERNDNFPKNDHLLSDDFEHVEHDFVSGTKNLLDHDDFLSSQKQQPPAYSADMNKFDTKFKENVKETDDLLKGITTHLDDKFDTFDKFSSGGGGGLFHGSGIDKKYSDVSDLLDFERNDGFAPPPPIPSTKPITATAPPKVDMNKHLSNYDIDEDYLNPYSSKNLKETKEKFISSEDLIEPMKSMYEHDLRKQVEPSSGNILKTEAMVHEEKRDFKPEPVKYFSEPIIPAKPPTPEPYKAPTPEPFISAKAPTPEPVARKQTPEPVTKKSPTPEPIVSKPTAKPVEISTSKIATTPKSDMISAEEMFCRIGLDAWFKPERLHPKVESLIYWRDPKKSGPVFGIGLALLIAMSCFSLISVFAYVSLLALAGTISFRIYKNILQAVQKTSEGHPFKEHLECDLSLSQDKVQNVVNMSVAHLNAFIAELRRLFLVEDLIDSIKFGLMLWCLTYLGAWFNGMTLVIIAFVALFTLPKVYENNKQSIDTYLDLVRSKILEITDKVKAAIPIGKKTESEKDK